MIAATLLWLLASGALSQDGGAASRPDEAAVALLAETDAKIYSAEAAGMTGVSFSYLPPATGPLDLPRFRVVARWRKGEDGTVEFRNQDGSPLDSLPEAFRRAPPSGGPSPQESFERGARSLVSVFRGIPYSIQFQSWRKRLESRVVNAREERTVVCEPAVAGDLRRVEIAFDRRGLPWRITSYLSRPEGVVDRIIDEPTWSAFDGKLVMTGLKKTRGAGTEQVVVRHQRKDGFIVPASYERLEPGKPPAKVVFEDVRVSGCENGTESAPSRPAPR